MSVASEPLDTALQTQGRIVFDRVTLSYPQSQPILADVSFSIEPGSFTFLTGASGSGKTSVLKLIHRLLLPTQGLVQVGKHRVSSYWSNAPALRKAVGFVYQDGKLIEQRSVFDNITLPLLIDRHSPKSIQERAQAVAQQCILEDLLHQKIESLSGGQRQRVGMARAIIRQPNILIADEPTANLDRINANTILQLLVAIRQSGKTILVSTHDTELIKAYPQARILLIKDHKIRDF